MVRKLSTNRSPTLNQPQNRPNRSLMSRACARPRRPPPALTTISWSTISTGTSSSSRTQGQQAVPVVLARLGVGGDTARVVVADHHDEPGADDGQEGDQPPSPGAAGRVADPGFRPSAPSMSPRCASSRTALGRVSAACCSPGRDSLRARACAGFRCCCLGWQGLGCCCLGWGWRAGAGVVVVPAAAAAAAAAAAPAAALVPRRLCLGGSASGPGAGRNSAVLGAFRCRGGSSAVSGVGVGWLRGLAPAPVLRQRCLEHVVHGDDADHVAVLVHDRDRDQVVVLIKTATSTTSVSAPTRTGSASDTSPSLAPGRPGEG